MPTEIQRTILVKVGSHECVTCQRCATTFAAVHPACPSCSQEFRFRADNDWLRRLILEYEPGTRGPTLEFIKEQAQALASKGATDG